MKKLQRIDIRLYVALFVCLFLSVFLTFALRGYANSEAEEKIYEKFVGEEEKLHLKDKVYVITIPSLDNDSYTNSEKNKLETQYINELKYVTQKAFQKSKGTFVLGTDLLENASNERQLLPLFRETENVFWHYNIRNIGYYHEGDKCGQIKFLDNSYSSMRSFEVYSTGKYDKNYLPYYMMTMDGGKVKYSKKKQCYYLTDKSGARRVLHAKDDTTVRMRSASKYDVTYITLEYFYQKIFNNRTTEDFSHTIFFVQSRNLLAGYGQDEANTQDLADYSIDLLATIENGASVPNFYWWQKVLFVACGVLFIGICVIFMPEWLSVLTYLLTILTTTVTNLLLVERHIFYISLFEFWLTVTLTFVLMLFLKRVLNRISVKNLPIDAVIRFTNTIVNIEHSVSYSEYLMKNRSEIEEDISAALLLPVMDRESFLLKELSEENHRNRKFVEQEFWKEEEEKGKVSAVSQTRSNLFPGQNYIAFIPLPVFDVESEVTTYTVIGLKKKLKPQRASYISMMLFSMYIYFKAQHERGEHQRMYFSMLSLMISVIDAKDPVTAGHSQRVANISKDIGIWLGLSKNDQFDLEFTALLHDIGKIGVSDYVLNKQSVYTQSDFEQMKYHTIRGAEMLSEVGIKDEIIDGVRHHHERIDGKGYPDGLRGDELHLFAKIIKIADVFDALTSKRQYKDAWEMEKALNIIYRGRGTEFDTEIADVFIKHMSPPGWIPPATEKKADRKRNPNTDKVANVVRDFYRKYQQYLSVEYPIPSKQAVEIDFLRQNGFMQYDWGETFNNALFLEEKPMILAYEKATKSLIFGQSSKENGVHGIYYYFFKGFVNMGAYLMKPSDTKKILEKLTKAYGEPIIMDEQMMIYEANKMQIAFYHTVDDKCLLFYVSDYMCSNYIFEKQEK